VIEINGKYGSAKIFTNNIDEKVSNQINQMLGSPVAINANMRIMPDVHFGAGCVIGTTMKIVDKVVPNFVGVDIGCGVLVQKIGRTDIDLERLDKVVRKNIPSGFEIRNREHPLASCVNLDDLICKDGLKKFNRFSLGIGTLGGGNHFIEIASDENGDNYLIIHTGSRNLGKQVADYYQQKAYEELKNNTITKDEIIAQLCHLGREQDIEPTLKSVAIPKIDKAMAYCEGELMQDYLHDMIICQKYASINRMAIASTIGIGMRWSVVNEFETVHNYIDMDSMILRKGAVSAKSGESLIIPMNMMNGSLLCVGKGNPEWNYSAPHGAGRIMSRTVARKTISIDDFKNSMNGIFTTCVNNDTIDEAPMAYKPMQEIIDNIGDTVNIIGIIKPIYNFKAGRE
jgi:RNA-splicing ligase RtcB